MRKLIGSVVVAAALLGTSVGVAEAAPAQPSIFQNNLWWFGKPNPNPPAQTVVWTFQPLNAILWAKPLLPGLWSWYESRSYQRCVVGISTTLAGPYSKPGQLVHSYSHKGCS